MTAPVAAGDDCAFVQNDAIDFNQSAQAYKVFSHDADTCCKACAADTGCVAASFTSGRRGPAPDEGFGLHLVLVDQSTSSGLTVAELEQKFTDRLGNLSAFDAFLE